tara:strand:+ start:247 stop:396 length:150 start_codon:yes stop_codon:yes gene_type:complete
MVEREALQGIIKETGMVANKYEGLCQSIDSKRGHEKLNDIWDGGPAPWM